MDDCKTRYPILLLHGLNGRDRVPGRYWGRIPSVLRAHGAAVYLGGQDACASIEANALQLRARILAVLRREQCEKVNLIAHSKGGLEARYLISTLKMAASVASLTTISTPHAGLKSIDGWYRKRALRSLVSSAENAFWRLFGDREPDFAAAAYELSAGAMAGFNAANPDHPEVFYQSWGASLNHARGDRLMRITGMLLRPADGESDGLVPAASAHWGHYRGTVSGVSHRDLANSRKKCPAGFQAARFYVLLVQDLVRRGF